MITDARALGQNGTYVVSFYLNDEGAKKFAQYTYNNIGKHLAIVIDGDVISAPVIR